MSMAGHNCINVCNNKISDLKTELEYITEQTKSTYTELMVLEGMGKHKDELASNLKILLNTLDSAAYKIRTLRYTY